MGNLVLKISRDVKKAAESKFIYMDVDAFSDKYAVGKVDLETDVAAVKAAVRNIFMWNVGEEILYPQFGNDLRKFLYQPMDETMRGELAQEVKRCVEDNEKRVEMDSVAIDDTVENKEHSTLRFILKYHVIGSKSPAASVVDTISIEGGNGGGTTIEQNYTGR